MTEQLNDAIKTWLLANRQTAINSLRHLVQINTENHAPFGHERNGQLAVAGMLNALGCAVDVYDIGKVPGLLTHPQYWAKRPALGRPNVMGIRQGQHKGNGKSLLLSSHIDTMPVGPDEWRVNPFGGEIRDGKLWGLGAYDMKAGLAASMMTVKALNDLGIDLNGDLMIESVVDEEYAGANGTLAARLKYNADLAIVPEPTNLVLSPAHHGGLMLRVRFQGKSGWGFSPDKPIDPVYALGRFIAVLNDWSARRLASLKVHAWYQDNPDLPVLINQVKAGEVELPLMAARVPSNAWLTVWIEVYPGMTQDEVFEAVQSLYRQAQQNDAVLADFEPNFEVVRWLSGSEIAPDHPGLAVLRDTAKTVLGDVVVRGAAFACDGHMFNLYSPTPMLLLGPKGGNPHSPDEFVDIDSYLQLIEIFVRMSVTWCGAG